MSSKTSLDPAAATAGELAALVALINAGRHIAAEKKARELLARDPSSGFLWKVLGVCLWSQGKSARDALQRAAQLSPQDAEVHCNLGNALLEAGQLDEAVQSCHRALALNPGLAEAHSNLGNALRALGRLDEAVVSYRRALQIKPDLATVHSNLGSALDEQGQLDEAVASYHRALQSEPRFATAHNNLGNALRRLGRLDEALSCYRQALEVKDDYAEAHNNLGNALFDLGRTAEAAASYRRALEAKNDYAEAHSNLGNALVSLGEPEAAAASCRKAIEIRSDLAEAHNNLGNALRALKHHHEALASYRRALEIKPRYAEAHANAGDVLLDLTQLDEAVASYRRALEIRADYAEAHGKLGNVQLHLWQAEESAASSRRALEIKPDYAEAYNTLGSALLDMGHMQEAKTSWQQALTLKADYAEAHFLLGCASRLESRMIEAEGHCRKALELDPTLIPALALSADLHADKGEFAQAERLLRDAAAVAPDSPVPWARMAHLRKMTHADAAWLSEAQRIAAQQLAPRQESMLRYGLGKYFDDVKDFAQAFKNYRRANELAKSHRREYDGLNLQRLTDQIIRLYDEAWVRRARVTCDPSSRPVFVVGLPRSGTTLAQRILASHPAVCSAGAQFYWAIASAQHGLLLATGEDDEALMADMAGGYLRLLEEFSPDALRVVDKMTTNFMCLGLIHAALPNARIIHMSRDPIDTCLSNYFAEFSVSHAHANDLQHLAHHYKEYARLMAHWRQILPADFLLDVRYEALVEDQETWTRRMLEFIGLPWDARCIDFHQARGTVITASRWQVRQKMYNASVERWRNYAPFIEPLLRAMQDGTPLAAHAAGDAAASPAEALRR